MLLSKPVYKDALAILFLSTIYIFIRSWYWDVPPIWDGRGYYLILLSAFEHPFDILNFGPYGHLSQGFLLIMGAPYNFFQRNYYCFNIWLSIFSLISVLTFYYLLKYFSRNKTSSVELILITAIFAFHPTILSSSIHFNPDLGALTFFLLSWLMLLYARPWWASAFALFMIFSKESSVFLWPLLLLYCYYAKPLGERRPWIQKNIYPALLPGLAVALFLIYKVYMRSQKPVWIDLGLFVSSPINIWHSLFWHFSPVFFNAVLIILVLNFNWILLLLWGSLIFLRYARIRRQDHDVTVREAFAIVFLFLFSSYFMTLFLPWSTPRYFLVPITLLLIGTLQWLWLSIPGKHGRIILLLAMLTLIIFSDFRTIDPVSKACWGTFSMGKHHIISINPKKDQIVYNLEFLNFPRLFNKFTADLHPSSKNWIVYSHNTAILLVANLDKTNFKINFNNTNVFRPRYIILKSFLNKKILPNEIDYLDFPNFDDTHETGTLSSLYKNQSFKTYDIDGYQLKIIHFWQPEARNFMCTVQKKNNL